MVEQPPQKIDGVHFNNIVAATSQIHDGMTIGHWHVGPLVCRKRGKRTGKRVHIVVSKCGVVTDYEPWEIASGRLPETCYACRPGEHAPPECRMIPERDMAEVQLFWKGINMGVSFEEKSQLNSQAGHDLWGQWGRFAMQKIIGMTQYGEFFGWKAIIHGYVPKSNEIPKNHRVRIKEVHKTERRVMFSLHPAGCALEFNVSLATGRGDVPFDKIVEEIRRVVGVIQKEDTGENYPPKRQADGFVTGEKVTAAAAKKDEPPVKLGEIDLSKLEKIAKGIETLRTVGKDVNEFASVVKEARARVDRANAIKGDIHVKKVQAEEKHDNARRRRNAANERVEQCEMSLRNALAARDNVLPEYSESQDVLEATAKLYHEAEAEANAAEMSLREAEAMEAERMRAVGNAKELAALLDALSKIGG